MHVLLVIFSLAEVGGAERVMSLMANYWTEKGWVVTIVDFKEGKLFYGLYPQVKHVTLQLKSKHTNLCKRIINYLHDNHKIKSYIEKEKPDLIISFSTGTNFKVLRAMYFSKIPIIVSERNVNSKYMRSFILKHYRSCLYLKAKSIVCQTQTMMDYFSYQIRRKSIIIPNPVPKVSDHIFLPDIDLPEGKILFAVVEMTPKKMHQKGYDLLIPIFSNLAKKHPDWHLVILNDGPEKAAIEKDMIRFNLQNRVHLPGKVKDIISVFKAGDLFVLSSRYEGFPNALCEAMACGLPVVSFDCPSGPADIIRHGIDGILVPPEDEEGLEKALDELMRDKCLRETMGKRAVEIVERFSVGKIMGMWEKLIYSTTMPEV